MCVEVTHDECVVIVGGDQSGEVWAVPWRAAGGRRDVDVNDVEFSVINCKGNSLVLNDRVTREKVVSGQIGELYGAVD